MWEFGEKVNSRLKTRNPKLFIIFLILLGGLDALRTCRQFLVLILQHSRFAGTSDAVINLRETGHGHQRVRLQLECGLELFDGLLIASLLAVNVTEVQQRAVFADGFDKCFFGFGVFAAPTEREANVVLDATIIRGELQGFLIPLDRLFVVAGQVIRIAQIV